MGLSLVQERSCMGLSLAGAQLHGAQLGGRAAAWGLWLPDGYPNESSEAIINRQIGEQSDLTEVIFAGGLTQEALDCIGNGLPDEARK